MRPYLAGVDQPLGDPLHLFTTWDEMRNSAQLQWTYLSPGSRLRRLDESISPPPPMPPMPPPTPISPDGSHPHCALRSVHSASRTGWGNANYAQNVGSQFTVEAWVSNANLHVNRCTRLFDDGGLAGTSWNAVTHEYCHPASKIAWPRDGTVNLFDQWPKRNSETHNGGQTVLFAIAEPDARAGWWKRTTEVGAAPSGGDGLLHNLCQHDGWQGLGMALVINHNGCPQLILGQRSDGVDGTGRGGFGSCIAVPEASHTKNGCPTFSPYDADSFAQCEESEVDDLGNTVCTRYTDRFGSVFNFRPVKAWIDSLETEPNKPHQIQVVVNDLTNSGMAEQLTQRDSHPRPEDTFTPKWSIYVDGELFSSSTYITPQDQILRPNSDQPPYDGTNSDYTMWSGFIHDMSNNYLPATAPVLSNLITPTMRLFVGTDGLEYNHWWVDDPTGVPADPELLGSNTGAQGYVHRLREMNPMPNAHPFAGNVELVALHTTAFAPQQARAQWSAGLPNRAPRITTGLVALSVLEDECDKLELTATDDDVVRFGKVQPVQWNVVSADYPVYSDAACTQQVVPSETNLQTDLYFKSQVLNYNGAYGVVTVRAHDGLAFSRIRSISMTIDAVVDGPSLSSASVELDPLTSVGIPFAGASVDIASAAAETGFRLKVVSLPATGRLYSGDIAQGALVAGPPLAVDDITATNVIYYESTASLVTASRVAQTETFQVRGVAPAGQNDAESPHVATGTVEVLSAMRPVTTTAVGVEDSNFVVTLRTFYTGSRLDVAFQIVGQSDVTLTQADGAEIVGGSEAAPVVLTGPVIDCADDARFKCSSVSVRAAENAHGRRLSQLSSATFSYQVVDSVAGVTSAAIPVVISIDNVLDPLSEFRCAEQFNFSREALTVVFPLADGRVNLTDIDGGTGDAGWAYVKITTSSYQFDVTLAGSPGASWIDPPSVASYQTYPEQAYDMVGFCPDVCTTSATTRSSATLGYECTGCLSPTDDVTGVTSFSAVMAPNLVLDTIRSVRIAIQSQGFIPDWNDQIDVQVLKFDNTSRAGYTESCSIRIAAEEEPFFESYASEGVCYFHSSADLLTRVVELISCAWFDIDGPVYWWFRGNGLTGGVVTQFLFGLWWLVIVLLLGICCLCIPGQSFLRYVLETLQKMRLFLDRDELERRGPRVESTVLQSVCLYGTCYGCFCCFPRLCLPRRENDAPFVESIRYWTWAYLTCKLFPQLRPEDEPVGPSWSEWVWDWFAWFMFRGFGLVPSMASWEARNPDRAAEYAEAHERAAAKRENRLPRGVSTGTIPLLARLKPATIPIATGQQRSRVSTHNVDSGEYPVLNLKVSCL